MYRVSDKGNEFLLTREAFRSHPYLDSGGLPTIGYGNTFYEDGTSVTMEDEAISHERAIELYKIIHTDFEQKLNRYLKGVKLKPHQFDMLMSLTYNIGPGAFKDSTLLKLIKRDPNHPYITREFGKWIKDNGVLVPGLANRRTMEAYIYRFGYSNLKTFNW